MATDNLDLIKHNLQEIYSAVHSQCPLVIWGNKLYSAQGSLTGRVIRWIDTLLISFFNPNYGFESVQRNLRRTNQLFEDHKKVIASQIIEAEEALTQWTREEIDLEAFKHRFEHIARFNEATRPFIKLLFHQDPRLKELFAFYMNNEALHFTDDILYARAGRLKHIHQLANLAHGSLPLHAFKNAVRNQVLDEEDTRAMKRWVKKMRRFQGLIDNRALCKGITSLVDFWNAHSHEFQAAAIEEQLLLHYPDYLLPDEKHIRWRATLNEGKIIEIDPKNMFVLGEPLHQKKEDFDNNLTFALKNKPYVVIIAQNRAVLKIRNHLRQNPKMGLYGVRSCQLLYVDPKGRFAFAERLYPVNDPKPIVKQLEWLVQQPYTPTDLNFRHLALNSEGYLVSVKSHARGIFNFNSLEQLAYDFCRGNKKLYHTVTYESGLTSLPHARYFRDCILKGLALEDVNIKLLAAFYTEDTSVPHDIWNPDDPKKGKTLYDEARESVFELRKSLSKFQEIHPNTFEKVLKEEIIAWWKLHCQAGRFWPNFKIEVAIMVGERLKSGSLV